MLKRNKDWLIVLGLGLLALVPIIAGTSRIIKVGMDDASPENARFLAVPIPIVIHILSASIYSLFGAVQLAPGFRRKYPRRHRLMGSVTIVLGAIVAATGIWMTLIYPPANNDNFAVYVARLLVGIMMLLFIAFGLEALRRKKYVEHGHWMIRTYALAMGAGTQVFTHLPLLVFPSIQGELSRSIFMISAWAINLVAAEWVIFRLTASRSLNL